ncbi:hypothetical protein F5878DRAFT_656015 [Lentinula raphanica]|uniref:Uncharacterized protein n=1 Tax=Lentinula raphanica TaxID=153919 RepID=A0AA38UMI8_9AGAR|nr:hypothetical protein F5878DRAFT_656015 [Lentinula raphanica]
MSKMRATIRIYEDPKTFTSEDVWEGASESTMTTLKAYAIGGLLSMAVVVFYAWKFTDLPSTLKSLSGEVSPSPSNIPSHDHKSTHIL